MLDAQWLCRIQTGSHPNYTAWKTAARLVQRRDNSAVWMLLYIDKDNCPHARKLIAPDHVKVVFEIEEILRELWS